MKQLAEYAHAYGIHLTQQALTGFATYAAMLLEWNARVNLTAITEPEQIAIKHFLDSLLLLPVLERYQGHTLVDVGTGAGFPAVPLKLARPLLSITLLDSLNKRVAFLQALSQALGQQNHVLHARAEDAAREPALRERFDFATARAVASLPALCEYCLPFVKPGGMFFALKGYDCEEEVQAAASAMQALGAELEDVQKFVLPMDNKRAIVCIRKISRTPSKYPRKAVKITKSPL